MKKTVTINIENLSEEERNLFVTLIEKSKKEKNKVWIPEENEKYYFLGPSGLINSSFYEEVFDEGKYSIGNCFHTEKKAKFIVEKLKVITELQRIAEENNVEINWDKYSQPKYHLIYSYESKNIIIDYTCKHKFNSIYFSSIEGAKKAIETIGIERLKKYYFEVEE